MLKKLYIKTIILKFIFYFVLFMTASCTHKNEEHPVESTKVIEVAQDIKIPQQIITELDKELSEEHKLSSPVYIFLPLQVLFTDAHQQTLKKPQFLFQFEKGGGEVDLSQIIKSQGSFYMSFPAEQFSSTLELLHLYYISQSPIKKIDNENYGLGCGKWVDLKSRYKKLQLVDFLKLNTTDLRYLHVLAGHFLFVFKQASQIYLTQLSITDSRFQQKLCNSLQK